MVNFICWATGRMTQVYPQPGGTEAADIGSRISAALFKYDPGSFCRGEDPGLLLVDGRSCLGPADDSWEFVQGLDVFGVCSTITFSIFKDQQTAVAEPVLDFVSA